MEAFVVVALVLWKLEKKALVKVEDAALRFAMLTFPRKSAPLLKSVGPLNTAFLRVGALRVEVSMVASFRYPMVEMPIDWTGDGE